MTTHTAKETADSDKKAPRRSNPPTISMIKAKEHVENTCQALLGLERRIKGEIGRLHVGYTSFRRKWLQN